jgi:hypothetical protein
MESKEELLAWMSAERVKDEWWYKDQIRKEPDRVYREHLNGVMEGRLAVWDEVMERIARDGD